MSTLKEIEQAVRWGEGLDGPAGRQLRDKLGHAGSSADNRTLLETVAELQRALAKERRRSDELTQRIEELAERIEEQRVSSTPDASAVSEASRALTRLVRGECRSQSAVEQQWGWPLRTHVPVSVGPRTRELATHLCGGNVTISQALEVICELADAIDDKCHEVEERAGSSCCECSNLLDEIDALADQRERLAARIVQMCDDVGRLLGEEGTLDGSVKEASFLWPALVERLRVRLPTTQ